mmetsp:Transcript_40112/g.115749  ORF Transcript_40112/g.115749 Transcript_40112/m.115749 type:complete len:366 (-) Transcript_40112:706-1803(-)
MEARLPRVPFLQDPCASPWWPLSGTSSTWTCLAAPQCTLPEHAGLAIKQDKLHSDLLGSPTVRSPRGRGTEAMVTLKQGKLQVEVLGSPLVRSHGGRGTEVALQQGELCTGLHSQSLQASCLEVLLDLRRLGLPPLQLREPVPQLALPQPVHVGGQGLLLLVGGLQEEVGVGPEVGHAHEVERAPDVLCVEPRQRKAYPEARQWRGLRRLLKQPACLLADSVALRCGVHVAPHVRLALEGDAAASVEDLQGDLVAIARDTNNDGGWLERSVPLHVGLVPLPGCPDAVFQQLLHDVEQVRRDQRERVRALDPMEGYLHPRRCAQLRLGHVLHHVGRRAGHIVWAAAGVHHSVRPPFEELQVMGREG